MTSIRSKMQRVVTLFACAFLFGAQYAVANPSDLDPTFGTGGKVLLPTQPQLSFGAMAAFVLVQPDGRIITVDGIGVNNVGVWRLNGDGTPDATFGGGTGLSAIAGLPPNLYGPCYGIGLQNDGKIVVALGDALSLARLLPDGSLDPAFGNAGVASLPAAISASGSRFFFIRAGIVIAANGRILAGGWAQDATGLQQFALARFQSNGTPDASFGTNGLLFTQIPMSNGPPIALAQQADGKVLMGGGDLVARFLPDGGVDSSFGFNGVVRNDLPIPLTVRSIQVQADGSIVVAGSIPIAGVDRMAIIRMDSSGNRDLSFGSNGGSNGLVTPQVDADTPSAAVAIALDSRQRIVVTGVSGDLNQYGNGFQEAVVTRLNPDGSPDAFFSAHGVTTFWDGYGSTGNAVAIQSGDRIVVGSQSQGPPFFETCGFFGNCLYARTGPAALFRLQGGDGIVPLTISEGRAIEYYYAPFDHYFITATPAEIAHLDTYNSGWVRTGQSFKVWTEDAAGLRPVCRFFSDQSFAPKSSHFYTPYPNECTLLQAGTVWEFEGDRFDLQLPQGPAGQGTCPAGTMPLYRLYNNGQGGAPNHRYTDSLDVFNQMLAQGWIFEGEAQTKVFACGPTP